VSVPTVVCGASMMHAPRAGQAKLGATIGVSDQYCLQVSLTYMKSGDDDA
jgi:hypothetical protein